MQKVGQWDSDWAERMVVQLADQLEPQMVVSMVGLMENSTVDLLVASLGKRKVAWMAHLKGC